MARKSNRRDFLKSSALAGTGFWVAERTLWAQSKSPNEKLNIASIGAGGQAGGDVWNTYKACENEVNVVALCDVDDERAAHTYQVLPQARRFHDYREMLEKMHKEIDAVIVGTPDHTHAPASIMAMKMGKHVYCEKPLTHTVHEARLMAETAAKYKVATQMGNQGTSMHKFREGVEVLRAGVIGAVREIHCWTNRPVWPQGVDALVLHQGVQHVLRGIGEPAKAPNTMKWDLWLGPASVRPYDPIYAPFKWRGWWDFGTGALGDMACHTANLAYMGCDLGLPTSVVAEVAPDMNPESFPTWSVIHYDFPARGNLPPVKYTWYDGGNRKPREVIEKLGSLLDGEKVPDSGCVIIGDKGKLIPQGDYGDGYKLLPEKDFEGYQPPTPSLPRSPGHQKEWVNACKGGPAAMSNFAHAAKFTEMVLLGCVAMRVGKRIEYDGAAGQITNLPKANQYLTKEYRKGWEL